MTKAILVKKVYLEAFQNLGHQLVKHGFKIYFWSCAALYAVVLYAFWYRVFTGFNWD